MAATNDPTTCTHPDAYRKPSDKGPGEDAFCPSCGLDWYIPPK